ncbi:MAG: hypothetical protein J6C97_03040 [Clostridia bacterium]|nr:hypothetical protein [Clostridia bacterium]
MYKFKIKISITKIFLIYILCVFLLFSGCFKDIGGKQKVYIIGKEHSFEKTKIKIEDDAENSRFIIKYTTDKTTKQLFFSFYFSFDFNSIKNSQEFEYYNQSDKINFDIDGYYIFYGSTTIYVYYNNARIEIKEKILLQDYSITIPYGTFVNINS